jgi:hypothetical protein
MAEKYTTQTASLKATTADIRMVNAKNLDAQKIRLNGQDIEELLGSGDSNITIEDGREVKTQYDIWEHAAVENEDGSVTVKNLYIPDASEWHQDNREHDHFYSVIDNKCYRGLSDGGIGGWGGSPNNDFSSENMPTESDFFCNMDTSKIEDGSYLFYSTFGWHIGG